MGLIQAWTYLLRRIMPKTYAYKSTKEVFL